LSGQPDEFVGKGLRLRRAQLNRIAFGGNRLDRDSAAGIEPDADVVDLVVVVAAYAANRSACLSR
jgi:hypothetical protein